MLPKQLFIGPLAYPGKKYDGGGSLWKKDVFSLKNLEFQVGGGCGVVRRSPLSKRDEKDKCVFTTAQIQELLFQISIFRHITTGLPAPLQVFLYYRREIFNHRDLDHTSMMDPEPKRCRRTDGKRWRCYLDALDDQKYCARHMHRGSHRSRKHVEVAKVDLNSNQVAVDTSRFSSSSVTSPRIAESISQASASVSTGLHLGAPSSYYNGSTPRNLQTGSASFSCNSTREEKGHQSIPISSFGTLHVQEKTRKESNIDHLKGFGFDQTITSQDSRCNQQNKNNPDVSVASELCLSPMSVCHSYTGTMSSDNKAGKETDTVRCQRTDGKRWQCKKNAVANGKYCESHRHRGAKRTRVDSKMNDRPGMTLLASTVGSHDIPKTSENDRNLNTDLTISLAGNSGIRTADTSSNSSSDATTVTDENVDVTSV